MLAERAPPIVNARAPINRAKGELTNASLSSEVASKLTNIPRGMLGFALTIPLGPNDSRARPAIVTI